MQVIYQKTSRFFLWIVVEKLSCSFALNFLVQHPSYLSVYLSFRSPICKVSVVHCWHQTLCWWPHDTLWWWFFLSLTECNRGANTKWSYIDSSFAYNSRSWTSFTWYACLPGKSAQFLSSFTRCGVHPSDQERIMIFLVTLYLIAMLIIFVSE